MLLWRRSEWCIHCSSGVGCVRGQEGRRRIHRCQCLKESGERVEERKEERGKGKRRGVKWKGRSGVEGGEKGWKWERGREKKEGVEKERRKGEEEQETR